MARCNEAVRKQHELYGFEMEHIAGVKTVNLSDIKRITLQLIDTVGEKPDLVVFVASGACLIGKIMAEHYDVPLKEIRAQRSGNQLKKLLHPVLKALPGKLKIWLRKREQCSGNHAIKNCRAVSYEFHDAEREGIDSILLVDDAVDTGNTMLQCLRTLQKHYPSTKIKTAALSVFDGSKDIVKVDYHIFDNMIVMGPWANDHKEHLKFMRLYKEAKRNNEF